MKTADHPAVVERGEEREICISCLLTNAPGTHFCHHCGTPLTCYATTAPFESIFALGDFLRKAISRGRWNGLVHVFVLLLLIQIVVAYLLGWMTPG